MWRIGVITTFTGRKHYWPDLHELSFDSPGMYCPWRVHSQSSMRISRLHTSFFRPPSHRRSKPEMPRPPIFHCRFHVTRFLWEDCFGRVLWFSDLGFFPPQVTKSILKLAKLLFICFLFGCCKYRNLKRNNSEWSTVNTHFRFPSFPLLIRRHFSPEGLRQPLYRRAYPQVNILVKSEIMYSLKRLPTIIMPAKEPCLIRLWKLLKFQVVFV